jgi:hypothetical protein
MSFNYLDDEHPIHVFKVHVREAARAAMGEAPAWTGPVHMGLSFVMPRVKHPKKHGTGRIPLFKHKGDIDNFVKAINAFVDTEKWTASRTNAMPQTSTPAREIAMLPPPKRAPRLADDPLGLLG